MLGRYVATKQRVRAHSLRSDVAVCVSDRAVCVLGRYVATELCNHFVVFPFSAGNLGVFSGFWENKFYPSEMVSENVFW